MANLNKVFLMGNLTRDPELRYSGGGGGEGGGGSAICKFGLATNRQWRDQSGQQQEKVTFVDITVFGRQAETCNEYLRKGRPVFIEGRLEYDTWDDRETGQKRSKLYVVAERVQFLGSPRDSQDGGGYRGRSEPAGATAAGPPSGGASTGPVPGAPGGGGPAGGAGGARPSGRPASGGSEGVDFDDIPF